MPCLGSNLHGVRHGICGFCLIFSSSVSTVRTRTGTVEGRLFSRGSEIAEDGNGAIVFTGETVAEGTAEVASAVHTTVDVTTLGAGDLAGDTTVAGVAIADGIIAGVLDGSAAGDTFAGATEAIAVDDGNDALVDISNEV